MGWLPVLCPETQPSRQGSCLPPGSPLLPGALLSFQPPEGPDRQSQRRSAGMPGLPPQCRTQHITSPTFAGCPQMLPTFADPHEWGCGAFVAPGRAVAEALRLNQEAKAAEK